MWPSQDAHGASRYDALEAEVDEVKALYKLKYGHSVDDEGQVLTLYDVEGGLQEATAGAGTEARRYANFGRSACFEETLDDIRQLYRSRYGMDLEDMEDRREPLLDSDGCAWTVSIGHGAVEQRQAYLAQIGCLEKVLDEVKELYRTKHGCTLEDLEDDSEVVYDMDGTAWTVSVGRGIEAQRADYYDRLCRLDEELAVVKALQRAKLGRDLTELEDEQEPLHDADGCAWTVSVGRGAGTQHESYSAKLSTLEESLGQAKRLYRARCGIDLEELEDENETFCDVEGTAWRVVIGRGAEMQRHRYLARLRLLSERLAEVKHLVLAKYGRGLEDLEEDEPVYDADGAEWAVTVGRGAAEARAVYLRRLGRLWRSLEEAMALYKDRYGRDVDEWDALEGEVVHRFDKDGTEWVGVGAVPWEHQRDAWLHEQAVLAEQAASTVEFDEGSSASAPARPATVEGTTLPGVQHLRPTRTEGRVRAAFRRLLSAFRRAFRQV